VNINIYIKTHGATIKEKKISQFVQFATDLLVSKVK